MCPLSRKCLITRDVPRTAQSPKSSRVAFPSTCISTCDKSTACVVAPAPSEPWTEEAVQLDAGTRHASASHLSSASLETGFEDPEAMIELLDAVDGWPEAQMPHLARIFHTVLWQAGEHRGSPRCPPVCQEPPRWFHAGREPWDHPRPSTSWPSGTSERSASHGTRGRPVFRARPHCAASRVGP